MCEREPDAFDDVGLAAVARPEPHRRRDVEQEPRRDGSLGDVDTHVQLVLPGGRVPVDPADVVALGVGPHLRELGAATETIGAMPAVDEARRPPRDAEVESAEQTRRDRTGPRLRPGPLDLGKRGRHAARSATSSRGTGTAASAASIRASSPTPVAMAS